MKLSVKMLVLSPLALAINTVTTVTAFAAEETPRQEPIESIVVVGETTNTVIEPENLEKYQANDLDDIFRHVPEVQVGGSLGIAQKIYIRGLEDTLINITVDGAPQTGTLFHHIGRVSVEPELLKSVEVQAGAGEATSGAGAIGGAIRFVTKNPNDRLNDEQQFGGKLKAGYFDNDGYKLSGTLYGKLSDNWGILGSYVSVERENMQDGDGNELYGTAADQTLAFVKLNGQLSDTQSLSLSFEQRDEEGDFGPRPNWPTLEGDTLYPMKGQRQTMTINHSLSSSELLNLESSAYITTSDVQQDRFDRWGLYRGEIQTFGFDIRNTSILGQHSITYGADYRNDEASSEYLAPEDVWQDWAWDPSIGKFEEEGSIIGMYIQDHWQLTDNFLLSYGLRYDQYDLEQITYDDKTDSSDLSPNIGFAYDLSEYWRLSAGYAEAMRGKEISDSFTLEHQPGRISLQPDLDAEEVQNTEVGVEFNNGKLMAKASVYYMTIDDVIHDQIGGNGGMQDSYYYENIGELEANGFEFKLGYQWESLTLGASYNNNDSELKGNTVEGYEHNGLANARGDTIEFDLAYHVSESLDIGWHYTHVADLNNIEVLQRSVELGWISNTQTIDKPAYDIHDLYIRWLPLKDDKITVDFSVINLFDEHYRDHSSVGDYTNIPGWEGIAGLYEAGRDLRLTVGLTF